MGYARIYGIALDIVAVIFVNRLYLLLCFAFVGVDK